VPPPRGIALALLTFIVLASAPVVATAADWPQFGADATHVGAAAGPEPPYAEAWSTAVAPSGPDGRFGLSAPIVIGQEVVAVGAEAIEVLDLRSGEVVRTIDRALGPSVPAALAGDRDDPLLVFTEGWGDGPAAATSTTPASTPVSTTPTATASPSESPSATANATDGFEGPSRIVAVGWPDGERRWEVDLPEVSRTGVTVAGDLAVVGSNDGTVTAVDVGTGTVAWTADAGGVLDQPLAAGRDLVLAPVRGDDTIAAGLLALDAADGAEAWRYAPPTSAVVAGSPAIADDAAYTAFSDGSVHAVDLGDGTERWRVRTNQIAALAPPALSGDLVVVVDLAGQVYAFDAATGERTWDHARNVPVFHPAPVAVGGYVVIGTIEGQVVAFDAADGDAVWHRDLGEGSIHGLAATDEEIVIVRGGLDAGVVALRNDPSAALIDERSPTIADPLRIATNWAAASLVICAALFLLGRFLGTRMGPPDLGAADEDATEPEVIA
jgi:outer membrane protein assembly factor BamB